MLHTILLTERSLIMLQRNIATSDGLMNGAMGIVKNLHRQHFEEIS